MGYALFAQRKVFLTGNLNMLQLQQTQRSNEQYLLATRTLSLQQQLSSIQSSQSLELAEMYELLSIVNGDGIDQTKLDPNKTYSAEAQAIINGQYSADGDKTAGQVCREAINNKINEIEKRQQADK